jgi:hypothetical protein
MAAKIARPWLKIHDLVSSLNFSGRVVTSLLETRVMTTAINIPSTIASMATANAQTAAIKIALMEMPRIADTRFPMVFATLCARALNNSFSPVAGFHPKVKER